MQPGLMLIIAGMKRGGPPPGQIRIWHIFNMDLDPLDTDPPKNAIQSKFSSEKFINNASDNRVPKFC